MNGPPKEPRLPVKILLNSKLPQVVLCSTQYCEGVNNTVGHVFKNDYEVFVQWLNP